MWICKDVFYETVASVAFRIGEAVKNTILFRVFDPVIQVAFFLVAKRFSVADKKLKIARVRCVDGGIVDFVDNAMAEREPQPATRMIGSAEAVFSAGRPAGFDSGGAKCDRVFKWIHVRISNAGR